jgi:hypothetical protein
VSALPQSAIRRAEDLPPEPRRAAIATRFHEVAGDGFGAFG